MTDLSGTILAKSEQLSADDLMGGPRTITVTDVRGVQGEQPIAINFQGDSGKPFYPCKSMRRALVHVWGKDGKGYVGRSMTIFRDPAVQFGGLAVGGIRISHMSDIDRPVEMALTATRGAKKAYKVQPLRDAPSQTHQPAEDAAAKWTAGFTRKVGVAENIDTLAALEAEQSKRLAELADKRPELHEQVRAAVKARFDALSPTDDFDAETGEMVDAG